MQFEYLERTPVEYSQSAVKVLHFSPKAGSNCFRLHWHDRIEIIYLKHGLVNFVCGTQSGILKEGSALIVPPRCVHYMKAVKDTVYDTLMFDIRFFYNETEICKKLLSGFIKGSTKYENICTSKRVLSCINRLCNEVNTDTLDAVSEVYRLLHLLIEENVVSVSKEKRNDDISSITEYLEKNFTENITSQQLSKKFGYTAAHLCRKFKSSIGLPPLTYLKIYRLERAYAQITESTVPISDIAEKTGFDDPNYFTRCFKSHFGHPPSYYRKKQ